MRYFPMLVALSVATRCIHRGEDGLAIALICFVALGLLLFWTFDLSTDRAQS